MKGNNKNLRVTFSSFSFRLFLISFSLLVFGRGVLSQERLGYAPIHYTQPGRDKYYFNPTPDARLFPTPKISGNKPYANYHSGANGRSNVPYAAHHYSSNIHHQQRDGPRDLGLRSSDNCRLPAAWKGQWFQSGVREPISINETWLGSKGTCYERSGDKFLFVERDCHRCIVINERHQHVLQYKESLYCEKESRLETLCDLIPGDAQLYSLFRIDAPSQPCPFRGAPFTFTYNRGNGECKTPVSYVETCTESSKLLLRYNSCPDVTKTESAEEELECLAEWKEGSHNYLLGKIHQGRGSSLEDSYRCFAFEQKQERPVVYQVGMSGDATCSGISSPNEGAKTLIFTEAIRREEGRCSFPSWMTAMDWYTLNSQMSATFIHHNTTLKINEEQEDRGSRVNTMTGPTPYHPSSNLRTPFGGISTDPVTRNGPDSLFSGSTQISCQSIMDISDGHAAIEATHTDGCKKEKICLHLYRRSNHVTEVQMIRKSEQHHDFNCMRTGALGPKLPYVTLISSKIQSHRCPNLGIYMVTGVSEDGRSVRDSCNYSGHGAFQTVVVGCGNPATMEFHSTCTRHEPITSYECHGSWEEDGTGFLIASPLSRSSTSAHRYCFMYSGTEEGLRMSSSSESCLRDLSPGVGGVLAFNLTIDRHCAEPMTGTSSRRYCDPFTFSTLLLFLVLHCIPFIYVSNNLVSM